MNTSEKTFALLVHSCDRYEFLYEGFEYFFHKHWDFTIPLTYYFATEEKDVNIKGFVNIKSGKGAWSDRLSLLLREKIKEDYVIYFQEDMWLTKDVSRVFFNELLEYINREKPGHIKLHSSDVYKTIPTNIQLAGFALTKIDNKASNFLMSHQIAIWNKQVLLEQMLKNEHPWRNERRGTKRLRISNPEIFHIDYFSENGASEINKNPDSHSRSAYYAVSLNGTLNDRTPYFIEELKKDEDAKTGEYANKLHIHYKDQLTHDGLPKPRKVDMVKRIKNWLFSKSKS